MSISDLIRAASGRVDAVRVVSSALNPLLWLTGLVTPLSLIFAYLATDPWKSIVFFVFAALPPVLTAMVFAYFMISDPDRLQSEGFRLRQQALKVIIRRGANTEVVGAATDIARIEKGKSAVDGSDEL